MIHLTDHLVELDLNALAIKVINNSCYRIYNMNYATNKSADFVLPLKPLTINFQEGLVAEVGTNGVTDAALLTIVIDRLLNQQQSINNDFALTHIKGALHLLLQPTINKMLLNNNNKVIIKVEDKSVIYISHSISSAVLLHHNNPQYKQVTHPVYLDISNLDINQLINLNFAHCYISTQSVYEKLKNNSNVYLSLQTSLSKKATELGVKSTNLISVVK